MQVGPAHILLAAPSSLFLLLIKLVTVSNVSVVMGVVLLFGFFFCGVLVAGSTGSSII